MKLTTYIIDNGLKYSGRAIYFVEAPGDFGSWFEETLVPWLRAREMRGDTMQVVGVVKGKISWRAERTTMSLNAFLTDCVIIEDVYYGDGNVEHRPRYNGI